MDMTSTIGRPMASFRAPKPPISDCLSRSSQAMLYASQYSGLMVLVSLGTPSELGAGTSMTAPSWMKML